LTALRSSEGFQQLLQQAKAAAELAGITLTKPRLPSMSMYRAAASVKSDDSLEDYYRISFVFPIFYKLYKIYEYKLSKRQKLAIRVVPD
jgi:hypothetical protein